MNALHRMSKISNKTIITAKHRPISNPLLRLSKRGSFWTGEAHDSFSITHGRPPIRYAYAFSMSWLGRILFTGWFAIQAEIVEHVYYGFPPEDWHTKWPKFWHKRIKPMPYISGECDLFDIYCWKGTTPHEFHHSH